MLNIHRYALHTSVTMLRYMINIPVVVNDPDNALMGTQYLSVSENSTFHRATSLLRRNCLVHADHITMIPEYDTGGIQDGHIRQYPDQRGNTIEYSREKRVASPKSWETAMAAAQSRQIISASRQRAPGTRTRRATPMRTSNINVAYAKSSGPKLLHVHQLLPDRTTSRSCHSPTTASSVQHYAVNNALSRYAVTLTVTKVPVPPHAKDAWSEGEPLTTMALPRSAKRRHWVLNIDEPCCVVDGVLWRF